MKDADVAAVSTPEVNWSVCVPVPVIVRFEKVATPFTALTVVVPVRDPPPEEMAAVTDAVLVVVVPEES